jgi:hypothetical protein
MPKYLIINPAIDTKPISQQIIYTKESILGTIIAKSRPTAKAKAIELTNIPNPLIVIYSSLTDKERELAESAPILWTQPEGNPKTAQNPRGAGYVKKYPQSIRITLDVGLEDREAEWYRSQPNKTALLREWIKSQC